MISIGEFISLILCVVGLTLSIFTPFLYVFLFNVVSIYYLNYIFRKLYSNIGSAEEAVKNMLMVHNDDKKIVQIFTLNKNNLIIEKEKEL